VVDSPGFVKFETDRFSVYQTSFAIGDCIVKCDDPTVATQLTNRWNESYAFWNGLGKAPPRVAVGVGQLVGAGLYCYGTLQRPSARASFRASRAGRECWSATVARWPTIKQTCTRSQGCSVVDGKPVCGTPTDFTANACVPSCDATVTLPGAPPHRASHLLEYCEKIEADSPAARCAASEEDDYRWHRTFDPGAACLDRVPCDGTIRRPRDAEFHRMKPSTSRSMRQEPPAAGVGHHRAPRALPRRCAVSTRCLERVAAWTVALARPPGPSRTLCLSTPEEIFDLDEPDATTRDEGLRCLMQRETTAAATR